MTAAAVPVNGTYLLNANVVYVLLILFERPSACLARCTKIKQNLKQSLPQIGSARHSGSDSLAVAASHMAVPVPLPHRHTAVTQCHTALTQCHCECPLGPGTGTGSSGTQALMSGSVAVTTASGSSRLPLAL